MANSDVRHVRCPRCHGLLQEPAGAPVYQCGGCGATLRAKNRSGVGNNNASPSSTSGLPPPPSAYTAASTSRSTTTPTPDAGDVASTSGSTPEDAVTRSRRRSQETTMASRTSDVSSTRKDGHGYDASSTTPDDVTSSGSRRQATGTRSRRPDYQSAGDLLVPATGKKEHGDRSPNSPGGPRESSDKFRRPRGTADNAERNSAISPGAGVVNFPAGTKDATGANSESQVDDPEKRRKTQARLPDAARNRELAPRSPPRAAAEPKQPSPSRDGGGKAPTSPSRRDLRQAEQDLAPLRHKILKAVDELKGDLSELFSRSPDLNPTTTTRATRRPPRLLPKQGDGAAVASAIPARRARHAAVPARIAAAAAPPRRGLPSRRYRRCRADPCCCEHAQPRTTTCHQHHGCCCQCHHHQGNKPECSSCRGHCGRPRKAPQQEWKPPPAAAPPKRRPPPRHHCRPVLKGAPFIICSSCFQLVQVPADFAVSTGRLRKLRCGACTAVLSYSYRDPGRKKTANQDFSDDNSIDQRGQYTDDGRSKGCDPFAPFLDGFGLSSYSTTEDEQQEPLHVSRNTSFDSVVREGVVGRLHRLMGYGSASELLLRHSPDLYESGFDDYRTTPDYDRKGKAVCIDAEDDNDDSDDDEHSGGAGMRSAAKGAVWPMPGKGPGAIRIK